ncbi:hypothetical protein C8Q73DRAFT_718341 [Cubamyces lactineus]|nr:hypothetical protein C8Q73DRAFT_718341 [Cubamyces lactineus]
MSVLSVNQVLLVFFVLSNFKFYSDPSLEELRSPYSPASYFQSDACTRITGCHHDAPLQPMGTLCANGIAHWHRHASSLLSKVAFSLLFELLLAATWLNIPGYKEPGFLMHSRLNSLRISVLRIMCGGHRAVLSSSKLTCKTLIPNPREALVAHNLPDGYWLQAFHFHKKDEYPDLIGYGLGFQDKSATITLYINPKNAEEPNATSWTAIPIRTMDYPVSMSSADLTGDGFNDIIICDRYGPTMSNLWDANNNDGGRVQWLSNPGSRFAKEEWQARRIGNSTGMHRLEVGHFTRADNFQILAIPIIPKSNDLTSPAPVIIFTPEYSTATAVAGPQTWRRDVLFSCEFRLIHDIKVIPAATGAIDGDDSLDSALVAGREGISHLYFSKSAKAWRYVTIGTGLLPSQDNPYWGSGSVDVGRTRDDPIAYIATCEGFHGNVVSVYIKKPDAPKGRASLLKGSEYWTRIVLDDTHFFGPLDPKGHTGTIHHVATGDFDGKGVDAFAIACMGAPIGKPENEGIYIYRPINLETGRFSRMKVSNRSAGRLAIAAFTNTKLDIASISYYVPGYHTGPERPSIRIDPNDVLSTPVPPPQFEAKSRDDIRAHRLDKGVLLLIPRPSTLTASSDAPSTVISASAFRSMPMIIVAGYRMHVYVVAPNATLILDKRDAVKVMHGEVIMKDSQGVSVHRGLAPDRHKAATTQIISQDGALTAGPSGAVFLRMEYLSGASQGPFRTMKDLPIANIFPQAASVSQQSQAPPVDHDVPGIGIIDPDVNAMKFAFAKVETLDWASSGKWDGFEFYNMTGFHVFFGDDAMDKVCHIQLWTLGLYETARFHIHDTVPFCEIHCCIANGGGTAGMRWFPDSVTSIDESKELTEPYVSRNTERVVVPALHEHGPLWKVQSEPSTDAGAPSTTMFRAKPKLLPNGCVDYPWHAWLASRFGERAIPVKPPLNEQEQSFDVWLAFEFPISSFQY